MTHDPDVAQLLDITRNVWTEFLGIGLSPVRSGQALPRSVLTGCLASVTIAGAWNGAVSVGCSRPLARRAAASMFALPTGDITPEHMQDALSELANIIGGNVKALLPGPSTLSLPEYRETPLAAFGEIEGGQVVQLSSNGDVLHVQVASR